MGYKPTLGGLKKAQEFLRKKGYSLPIFQTNIYDDGQLAGLRWMPGNGRTISIDEAIHKYGEMCEVEDVRLANEQGDKCIQFSRITRAGMYTGLCAKESGWDVIMEFRIGDPPDYQFKDFINSADGIAFVSLARWGKASASMLDRIGFSLFPKHYARKNFAWSPS